MSKPFKNFITSSNGIMTVFTTHRLRVDIQWELRLSDGVGADMRRRIKLVLQLSRFEFSFSLQDVDLRIVSSAYLKLGSKELFIKAFFFYAQWKRKGKLDIVVWMQGSRPDIFRDKYTLHALERLVNNHLQNSLMNYARSKWRLRQHYL